MLIVVVVPSSLLPSPLLVLIVDTSLSSCVVTVVLVSMMAIGRTASIAEVSFLTSVAVVPMRVFAFGRLGMSVVYV